MSQLKFFQNKVINFIKDSELIKENDFLLVAFSGGPDSLCLLDFLNENKNLLKIKLAALYVDHNLRGAESKKDGDFCEAFCQERGIEFYRQSVYVQTVAKKEKLSIEEAARKLRYKALESKAEEIGANLIATGHNANDNLETVLLNLVKGKSLSAVAGIPPRRGKVIRPLLAVKREEILNYLAERKLSYRTDRTNLTDDYERNFLRNKIIPLLKENLNPELETTVGKASLALREEALLLEKIVARLYPDFVGKEKNGVKINLDFIEEYGIGLLAEFVKKIFVSRFGKSPSFSDLEAIKKLVKNQTGRKLTLSENIEIIREREGLVISGLEGKDFQEVQLKVGEKISTWMGELSIENIDPAEVKVFESSKNIEFVDAEHLSEKFVLRRWQQGDKFFPLGMKKEKKVSDLLTDEKVPAHLKSEYLVLLNKNEIVWLVGVRISEKFKITKETKRILKLCLN